MLKPEDCSPLGREILRYLEEHQMSMNSFAKKIGKTQDGVRWMCQKKANPTVSTIEKLAEALDLDSVTLNRIVYRNKLNQLVGKDNLDQMMDIYDGIYAVLRDSIENWPEEERPSESLLFDRAFKAVKSLQLPVAS
ncbi:helix-turn-helix domain-containing protein [Thalassoporum mexicanum]|uniref:helix-turn-helix domain-containing protein n=1 Tax=Thalassoporum mexicanum TaxID=3457544 RepID=UPI0018DD1BFF|nr:helix-turn-helix transcriptional regulator [Pseudanabaena sp. PCC 7367]